MFSRSVPRTFGLHCRSFVAYEPLLVLICVIVFLLQCLFSKFKKSDLLFFSPSLYHLALDLIMAPFVLYCIIFSNSFFLHLIKANRICVDFVPGV